MREFTKSSDVSTTHAALPDTEKCLSYGAVHTYVKTEPAEADACFESLIDIDDQVCLKFAF